MLRFSVQRAMPRRYGRFGGGWEWALGFKASRRFRVVVVHLLVLSLRIERDSLPVRP